MNLEGCQCGHGSRRELLSLFALEALLTGLAVLGAVLAQPELAVVAGVGCVSLADRIAGRLAERGSVSR